MLYSGIRLKQPVNGREAAAQVIYHCLALHDMASFDPVLRQTVNFLSLPERNLAVAIVYGTMTYLYTIDYVLGKHCKIGLEKLDPWLKSVLRTAVWQLRYSRNLPETAVVNECCKLVKKYRHQGMVDFANAVMRAEVSHPVCIPPGNLALQYSLLPELAGYFKKRFGIEQAKIELQALLMPPDLTVRVNRCRSNVISLINELKLYSVAAEAHPYFDHVLKLNLKGASLTELPAFKVGKFFVQGIGAMLVGMIAPIPTHPDDNHLVIDLCAAPGGKITHVLERLLLSNKSTSSGNLPTSTYTNEQSIASFVEAWDINQARLDALIDNLSRLGLPEIKTAVVDATDRKAEPIIRCSGKAALVIADVPCSGLGVLARKPELRWNMNYEKICRLLPLQAEILRTASLLTAAQGYLLYSTCTLNWDENEGQVNTFLESAEGQEFTPVDLTPYLPVSFVDRLDEVERKNLSAGKLNLLPARDGCEGFFISLLQRKENLKKQLLKT